MTKALKLILALCLTSGTYAQTTDSTNKTTRIVKHRIGATAVPFLFKSSIYLTYERRFRLEQDRQPLAVGLDVGYRFNGSIYSNFDHTNVRFNSHQMTINPWIGGYFRSDDDMIKDVLIPKMVMVKPSLVFANTRTNGNMELFPAYEMLLGNVVDYERVFFKVEYGLKHFLRRSAISGVGRSIYFPSSRVRPVVRVLVGINF